MPPRWGSPLSAFFILPLQGVWLFFISIFPGRCPGLSYAGLSGRTSISVSRVILTFIANSLFLSASSAAKIFARMGVHSWLNNRRCQSSVTQGYSPECHYTTLHRKGKEGYQGIQGCQQNCGQHSCWHYGVFE